MADERDAARQSEGNLRTAIANGIRVWKCAGAAYFLLWVVDRLLCHTCKFQILIVRFHDREWLRNIAPPRVAHYVIRWASREEVIAAADGAPEWLQPERARATLDRGERCMAAFLDGQMVACSWGRCRARPVWGA